MSRNRGRVGGPKKRGSSPPPAAMKSEQEGSGTAFSFVVPTEFVDLPSKGKFYAEGHPLHGESTIEIRHMTAKEEDILTSRALLKKGVALDRLIKNIIVNKAIDPTTLLVGDRNAIIIAARISGYGEEYETQVTCPACATVQKYQFDLNDAEVYEGEDKLSAYDISPNDDGTFEITLPRSKAVVIFRLLSGKEEKLMVTGMESDRKRKGAEKNITRQLMQLIVSVNGDASQKMREYLVQNIPSMDSRYLRHSYDVACPNVDLTQHFECSECDYSQDMEVPLTADFFWPDR